MVTARGRMTTGNSEALRAVIRVEIYFNFVSCLQKPHQKASSLKSDAYFRQRFGGTNKRREAAQSLGSAQPVCERGEQNQYQKPWEQLLRVLLMRRNQLLSFLVCL